MKLQMNNEKQFSGLLFCNFCLCLNNNPLFRSYDPCSMSKVMRVPFWFYRIFHKFVFVGERIAYSVGANFTPHVITVNAGEVCTDKYVWNETWSAKFLIFNYSFQYQSSCSLSCYVLGFGSIFLTHIIPSRKLNANHLFEICFAQGLHPFISKNLVLSLSCTSLH